MTRGHDYQETGVIGCHRTSVCYDTDVSHYLYLLGGLRRVLPLCVGSAVFNQVFSQFHKVLLERTLRNLALESYT